MAVGVGWTNICGGSGSLMVENQAGDWNITTSIDYTLPYGKIKDKEGNDVQVDYIPASQGYIYEETPCTDAWQRDPNWMPIPDVAATDEVFYGLLLVFENDYNLVTWTTNVGATVDVGDGTAPIAGTGSVQSHLYDYSTLAGTVYQYQPDPSVPARNYKQVMFEVSGTITALEFRSSLGVSASGVNNFVDINCSLPNRSGNSFRLSSITLRRMSICERARIWNWNGNYIATTTFEGMTSLRVIQLPVNDSGSNYSGLFNTNANLDVGDLTTSASTLIDIGRPANNNQSIRSIGDIVANSVGATGCVTMFYQNYNLTYVGSLTSSTATSIALYATDCVNLYYHGEINVPNTTTLSGAFDGCFKLRSLNFTDCSNITVTTNAVRDCHSLYDLIMTGLTVGINLSDTNLANYGMSRFANSLGTASGSQTITVTGTPFGALLAASDATALTIESVMTGKGFTVAN